MTEETRAIPADERTPEDQWAWDNLLPENRVWGALGFIAGRAYGREEAAPRPSGTVEGYANEIIHWLGESRISAHDAENLVTHLRLAVMLEREQALQAAEARVAELEQRVADVAAYREAAWADLVTIEGQQARVAELEAKVAEEHDECVGLDTLAGRLQEKVAALTAALERIRDFEPNVSGDADFATLQMTAEAALAKQAAAPKDGE